MSGKILLPSDGSVTSLKAAAYAVRLMKLSPEIKLTILVVIPESSVIDDTIAKEEGIVQKINTVMETRGKEILDGVIDVFKKEGLNVEGKVEKGDPAGVIVEYAERGNYEHIIMGSRGVSELKDMAVGSVSHKVIHLANCRVTLVK